MKKPKPEQFSLFSPQQIKPLIETEYFVLLSPDEEIKKEVKILKEKIQALGIECESLQSIAHISLFKTKSADKSFPDLIEKVLFGQKKLNVKLIGTAIFEHGVKKTLYLKIENPEPIKSLYALLTKKSEKSFTPHITIAKNVTPEDFTKLESIISEFNYFADWTCENVTILKKPLDGKAKKYDVEREIALV